PALPSSLAGRCRWRSLHTVCMSMHIAGEALYDILKGREYCGQVRLRTPAGGHVPAQDMSSTPGVGLCSRICSRSRRGEPPRGTLKIYADSLKPNIPYKTILLSTRDTADFAVVEALEKYGLEKENPREYCIARVKTVTLNCRRF
ncbi:hypothetical protein XENOCAPTIV_017051, partial [Xenoophorus captivus]